MKRMLTNMMQTTVPAATKTLKKASKWSTTNSMKSLLISSCIVISLCAMQCSQQPTSVNDANGVQLYSGMESSVVTPGSAKLDGSNSFMFPGLTADSLAVDRIRILVKDLKIHMKGVKDADSDKEWKNECERSLRVGPFLIVIDTGGARLVAASPLPNGNFDHMKLEIHRFSNSEVSTFINDSTYGDFVTGDRYSIIIEGRVYEHGIEHAFRFNSAVTLNLMLTGDSTVVISPLVATKLALLVDPAVLFRSGVFVLDPRDPNNREKINNDIKRAFTTIRRLLK